MRPPDVTRHLSLVPRAAQIMTTLIEPGQSIGVLGGGQLGAMFASAARRLGYRTVVWDPDRDAPAFRQADVPIVAPFTDASALTRFRESIVAATYEWENVPYSVGAQLQERRIPVRPAPGILGLLQNRIDQKNFLVKTIPVVPFRALHSSDELFAAAPHAITYPAICKTATSGYDGKGQWRLNSPEDFERLRVVLRDQQAQSPQPGAEGWVIEDFLDFDRELSVIVVRGSDGETRTYPVADNFHEVGILRISRIPAKIDSKISDQAQTLARSVVEALDGVGVFCIEMFLMADGRLFVNEVAPRPHNSGHYTLDACTVSQFEQQVRTLCCLPLGEVRLLSQAVMLNLLGEELIRVTAGEGLVRLLGTPGTKLRIYGKTSIRPRRKMGHVTFLAENAETAWEEALALRSFLANAPSGIAQGKERV